MNTKPPKKWLTLGQASDVLGVHPATLRDWADEGLIPSYHTPGGHRRFVESDVQSFLAVRESGKGRRGLPALLDRAISHTQNEIRETGSSQAWMNAFSTDARARQRELGRRLLGVLIQYLARESQVHELLAEAQEIGAQYGRECFAAGLSLTDTVRAFFFFRDSITEVTVWLPQSRGATRQDEMQFFQRVNEFLNHVHLAIVEAYDRSQHAG